MANSVSDTCQIYPALIHHPESFVDRHGGLEHARSRLGSPVKMEQDMNWTISLIQVLVNPPATRSFQNCWQDSTFFLIWRERYSLHECNDNNLKEMCCPLQAMKLKLTTHPGSEG